MSENQTKLCVQQLYLNFPMYGSKWEQSQCRASSTSSTSSCVNGEQECVGQYVCRPVIVLRVLLGLCLKKFKSLFSCCCYSDGLPSAHCYSGRVREGGRERQAQNGRLTAASCTGATGCTGAESAAAFLAGLLRA